MTRSTFGKTFRLVAHIAGIVTGVVALVALAYVFRLHIANDWQQYTNLPSELRPGKDQSIVVFSPHSDDETLGCGGLLAEAARNGAKVRVALLTNGDGFWFAASRDFKSLRLSHEQIIKFGCKRQGESLRALKHFGIPKSQVTFLGYPDRGLAKLWDGNWNYDQLYTSRATGVNHSPYASSLTPQAPYCGEQVLRDVEKVLRSAKPTDVYIPHPLDNHIDHYATYCFVTAAIKQLKAEGVDFARKIKVHVYLVHRGDWPVPKGYNPKMLLAPPYAIASGDTKWTSLGLPDDIAQQKLAAIKEYKTQTAVERGFMMSFARNNELFGTLQERRVHSVLPDKIRMDGEPQDWAGIPPSIVDPVGDYVVANMSKGGDVRSIYTCADNNNLYIRIDCVKRLSKRVMYTVNLRGIGDRPTNDLYSIWIKPPLSHSPTVASWACKGNMLELAVPLKKLRLDDNMFIQVKTQFMRLTVDNTGWQELELASKAPSN